MTDLYSRQTTLQLHTPRDVTVIGCGGIGAWVAIDCAMSGVESIYLFDPDVLEESNRNRLPFCQSAVNRPKVEVLAEYIQGIRPECLVVPIAEKLEGMLLDVQLRVSTSFIDCTDSPKAQHTISRAVKNQGRTYIRAGYDGTHITVTGTVSGWIKTDVEEATYTVAPSWVVPAQVVAALAVGRLMKYTEQEVCLDISEIGMPAVQRNKRVTARCRQVVRSE